MRTRFILNNFFVGLDWGVPGPPPLGWRRDRATLRVIENFAKSLKVIRNDTVEQGVCKSLFVFH